MITPYHHNTDRLDMTEAQFRALPREALMLLENAGCQWDAWRDRKTGAWGYTIYMPPGTIGRLLTACAPPLAA